MFGRRSTKTISSNHVVDIEFGKLFDVVRRVASEAVKWLSFDACWSSPLHVVARFWFSHDRPLSTGIGFACETKVHAGIDARGSMPHRALAPRDGLYIALVCYGSWLFLSFSLYNSEACEFTCRVLLPMLVSN